MNSCVEWVNGTLNTQQQALYFNFDRGGKYGENKSNKDTCK